MMNKPHQDIKHDSWIVRILPEHLRPYALLARFDRPIGVWLLLLPGLWSLALLAPTAPAKAALYAVYFAIGSVLMRGAGCVINDIWDRDLDKGVERTASRPLAAGIVSVKQAFTFLALLMGISLLILLQFNTTTIILGFCSVPFIVAYPLMKRITWWPQLFLGLTFNFAALMAWSAMTGTVSITAISLYSAGIFWTLAYDTIYAHQDKDDDALIGIKSTALRLGNASPFFVYTCYAAAWALLVSAAGKEHIIALMPAGIYALYLCRIWQADDKESSLNIFKQSKYFGLLATFGLLSAEFIAF